MFDYLRSEVQRLLDEGITRDDAVSFVVKSVEETKNKRKMVIEEAVNVAASHTVSQAFTQHRRSICRRAEAIGKSRENGGEALKEKVAGLMNFRLPSGAPLASATGNDCIVAADSYMTSARVHYHRASFLRDIGARAGKSRVGDVLTEDDLQDAYENAGVLE